MLKINDSSDWHPVFGAETMHRLPGIALALLMLVGAFALPARADDTETCRRWVGDDALAACTRLVQTQRGGDVAQAYVWRGITYMRFKGDWDRAIADFNEGLRLGSKDPGAYA